MKLSSSLSKITVVVIILLCTFVSSNLSWGKDRWKGIVESDAKGYYAYLPAIFIYHDLNFGFFDKIEKEKYYNPSFYYDYRSGANEKIINKYYCGVALLELPFFLMAHFLSYIQGYDPDGYSKLYHIFVNISGLFYLFIGLIYLSRTLTIYKLNEWQKSLVLLAAVFGTNLFYYAVVEPGMSHVFSFCCIAMFVYYSKQFFENYEKKYILLLGLVLGVVILIRPINGLIIFSLPFIAGSLNTLKKGIATALAYKVNLILTLMALFCIPFIQLIIYKISTGSFFVYSYQQEGFNFLSPHFIDILFSYRKGLFLYTPLYLVATLGLYYVLKKSKYQFFTWLGFFVLITYIFSSWWMWYYGGSFSSRVYVEFIPLFMILLGISVKKIQQKIPKYIHTSLIIILIVVCQIQTYQYRYFFIHWSGMTKERYWEVFLKTDKNYTPVSKLID
ncbi:MAG: hypothetical protein H6586_07525 [Flavobacteriales bacterium]|nr:hypothetical protein [Flavobacteriales bacterium]